MNLGILIRVLAKRRALRAHERSSRARLLAHQQHALAALRAFAVASSPFYRSLHRGLAAAPLAELPVVTKTMMMSRFDDVVTDRALRLVELERYLGALQDNALFAGRYWVSATSGSSGHKAVVPNDLHEWTTILASYARANEWSGIRTSLVRRVTMAVVSSTNPGHQSARVAATLRSPFVVTHRFDAGQPLAELVEALNRIAPEVLVAYASMVRILAEEQLRGRLRIAPRAVNCSSEVLTKEARLLATRAWGHPPFEVYAATEAGGIGAECGAHAGLHLFEDLVIPEVVDDEYRPVPDGVTGERLLVTVLFSRTLPLLRYELTDRVRIATRACPCGRVFRLVEAIEGRTDDVLHLRGAGGGNVTLHPVVLEHALDPLRAAGWQVRHERDRLRILVAAPGDAFSPDDVAKSVREAIERAGAESPPVDVELVQSIPAAASGKRPLVVAAAASSAGGC